MSIYRPFLIANQRVGLELNLDPWLLPSDAYTELNGFLLVEGRIEKGRGEEAFGQLADLPVTGIFNYRDNVGNNTLFAMDTTRIYAMNLEHEFVDRLEEDSFTGTDADLFQAVNWLNTLYFCNGVDDVGYFDGTDIGFMDITAGGEALTAVKLIFPYHSRLVFLNLVEGATRFAQRARWSDTGDPNTWPTANYLDAPTNDQIKGAAFVNDELIVFFDKSTWILRYAGDPELPFYWTKISSDTGTVTSHTVLSYKNIAYGIAPTHFFVCDQTGPQRLDLSVPRLVLNANIEQIKYACVMVSEPESQVWFSYPSIDSASYCDQVAVYNLLDKSWNLMNLTSTCFGTFERESTPTWDDLTGTWDECTIRWENPENTVGYPLILMGKGDGTITSYSGNATGSAVLKSGKIAPFISDGKRSQLGWIDFLVDTQAGSVATFKLFTDGKSKPYVEQAVELDDGSGNDKSWIRIFGGAEAQFHQFGIEHSGTGGMVIHAIVPYLKPSGRTSG